MNTNPVMVKLSFEERDAICAALLIAWHETRPATEYSEAFKALLTKFRAIDETPTDLKHQVAKLIDVHGLDAVEQAVLKLGEPQ